MDYTAQDYARQYATQYGVPYSILSGVIAAESSWNPLSFNQYSGASGLGQVLPSTAANPGFGVQPLTGNLFDVQGNVKFTADYLKGLYDHFGTWYKALQFYTGSGSGVPYGGNSGQQTVLNAVTQADNRNPLEKWLQDTVGIRPAGQVVAAAQDYAKANGIDPSTAGSGSSNSKVGEWVTNIETFLSKGVGRIGIFVLGAIVVFVAANGMIKRA